MMNSTLKRVLLRVVAVAGVCAAAAGCASDVAAPAGDGPVPHMRYYGGPKSPMWQGQ
ncbi:hypothetical protein H8B02_38410 [Bradyrhizobium sp. Pear77]|uniref:hypothetical protein n=1 Tax=Bradyrhizobium altum TaxID=1571202 RepID=UPI001E53152A|nr:hypothetical protein [Bradyrhizobium altum]MCC8959077.1 hypothetical protein [Bradyrhizobium altum]